MNDDEIGGRNLYGGRVVTAQEMLSRGTKGLGLAGAAISVPRIEVDAPTRERRARFGGIEAFVSSTETGEKMALWFSGGSLYDVTELKALIGFLQELVR